MQCAQPLSPLRGTRKPSQNRAWIAPYTRKESAHSTLLVAWLPAHKLGQLKLGTRRFWAFWRLVSTCNPYVVWLWRQGRCLRAQAVDFVPIRGSIIQLYMFPGHSDGGYLGTITLHELLVPLCQQRNARAAGLRACWGIASCEAMAAVDSNFLVKTLGGDPDAGPDPSGMHFGAIASPG